MEEEIEEINKKNLENKQRKKRSQFNTIEEYEAYQSDCIKDSLSVFIHFVNDLDIFKDFISMEDLSKHTEINVSNHLQKLIEDIKLSSIAKNKIENNIRESSTTKEAPKKKKQRVHYYFSKENGTNLAVTDFINPFQQKNILSDLQRQEFYNKKSELELISENIINKLKKRIFQKFEIAFEEGVENERWTVEGTEIPKNEDSRNKQSKASIIKNKTIIDAAIKRLYPKPSEKEIINNQFYVDKINEFHKNGNYLIRKIDFNKLFEEMKIQPKEDYEGDIGKDVHLQQEIINDFYSKKDYKDKETIKELNADIEMESFKRGELIFDKKSLLVTKSKMYIKVDRKAMELKIEGKRIDANSNEELFE